MTVSIRIALTEQNRNVCRFAQAFTSRGARHGSRDGGQVSDAQQRDHDAEADHADANHAGQRNVAEPAVCRPKQFGTRDNVVCEELQGLEHTSRIRERG